MKLLWMSDIHLNFLSKNKREEFYNEVKEATSESLLITGDIGESQNFVSFISEMSTFTQKPVHFVLGNHDFYGSSVKAVKKAAKALNYLPAVPYVELSEETVLLGVDGWGDCRNGEYENSQVVMSDWLYIDELRKGYGKGMASLKETLQDLADKDARALRSKVQKAIKDGFKRIIIASHVPPFEQACLYAGRKSTPDGLPFFSSQILGTTIFPIAKKNKEIDFLWLSGHTHSKAMYKPLPNLTVKVAKAEYCWPKIEEEIEYE